MYFKESTCCFREPFSEEVAPWRKGEKRECRFVFIGKNLDEKALEQGLIDCKAEDLRFNVGDTVYANIGEFAEGKILKCWDQGNPTESRFKMKINPMFGCQLITMILFVVQFNSNIIEVGVLVERKSVRLQRVLLRPN